MIAASASIEGCGGVIDAFVAAVDGAERAVDGSDGDGDMTSEEASSVTSALALASIVVRCFRRRHAGVQLRAVRGRISRTSTSIARKTMENGALDIHDAAAWDDSALVAAYDAAIEKYEETHGGSSARGSRSRGALQAHVRGERSGKDLESLTR